MHKVLAGVMTVMLSTGAGRDVAGPAPTPSVAQARGLRGDSAAIADIIETNAGQCSRVAVGTG